MESAFILASSSPFRKSILEKILPKFSTFSPDIDETPHVDEKPIDLVLRLGLEKAKAAERMYKQGIAIGSDQIALFDGEILGKPLTRENAFKQLSKFSGQHVQFITSIALYDLSSKESHVTYDITSVYFRPLSETQINHYLEKEDVLNCAGSFKSEGLGICLFDKITGEDPNALVGLPLIKLTKLLNALSIEPLSLK